MNKKTYVRPHERESKNGNVHTVKGHSRTIEAKGKFNFDEGKHETVEVDKDFYDELENLDLREAGTPTDIQFVNGKVILHYDNGRAYMTHDERHYDFPYFTDEGIKEIEEQVKNQLSGDVQINDIDPSEKGMFRINLER